MSEDKKKENISPETNNIDKGNSELESKSLSEEKEILDDNNENPPENDLDSLMSEVEAKKKDNEVNSNQDLSSLISESEE